MTEVCWVNDTVEDAPSLSEPNSTPPTCSDSVRPATPLVAVIVTDGVPVANVGWTSIVGAGA